MLSAKDLADLRALAKAWMPDRIQVIRPGDDEDPMGGGGGGPTTVVGEEQAAISSYVSQSQLVGDQQRVAADLSVTIPGDSTIDIQPQDRVKILPDGITYEVQGYPERAGRFQITKQLLVSRL